MIAVCMVDVYFTWPDRGLAYECRGCGACCKGLGIGIDAAAGQLVQLVARRPELAAFVRRRGDAVTAFNPRDRCWFLEDDGLCRIEVEDGRAAKPASCRLFPFNRVFHVGDVMVVDYNSVICPLRRSAGGDGVAHADVIAEIDAIRDPAITGTSLPADGDLAGERALAERIFALLGASAADGAAGVAALVAEAGVLPGWDVVVGSPWRAPEGDTLLAALLVTPSLRFNELYGPRQYRPRDKMAATLSAMWIAWLGFAQLGARLAQRALGMQELTTIWSEQAPLMHALARWNDAPYLRPGPVDLTSEPLVKQIAQRFVDNKQKRRPLGELLSPLLSTVDPARRVATLKLADAILKAALA